MTWFSDLLGNLATDPVGRSRRISSNEQPNWNSGNFDFDSIAPGATLNLPILEGPGVVTHIWLTSHAGLMDELNCLSLRVYYDGRPTPGVEVPLGAFFAVSGSHVAAVDSLPVIVSSSGALTSYWRMPFAASCRITVSNDHPSRTIGLYWQVDYTSLPELPPGIMYFHAAYRQEYPAVSGRDYLIFDGRGRGRYVGTVMEVTLAQDGWFGEGDDYFYIDGEQVPSLQGTGSEDYFNDAWGFRPRSTLWFGQPYLEGYASGDTVMCYRWHVLDPVHFHSSLKVTMEHKGNAADATDFWYLERPDLISSVAYWYQSGEPAPFGGLPTWAERRVPWESTLLLPLLRRAGVEGAPPPAVDMQGLFGMRPSITWAGPPLDGLLTFPFSVGTAGRYAAKVTVHAGPGGGEFDILLDGREGVRGSDMRLARGQTTSIGLGEHELEAGTHRLTFRSHGTGDLRAESVRTLLLPPKAGLSHKRPDHEGHFVRLAIGRAVYAHRLMEDTLPGSLQALVDAGLLESRFLRDENNQPLHGRLRGNRFHVEGAAWKHEWEGIDARH